MILYMAADLLWATRIKETATDLALPCRPARTPDMLRQRLGDADVRALIVDLSAEDAAIELIRALREAEAQAAGKSNPHPAVGSSSEVASGVASGVRRRVRVLAFGPHVRKELLQAARDAGADEAIPNGAFEHALPEILLQLGSR
ncbi:MAG: hypothetical protein EA378_09675 [Phycisphaerales bacterium]|nr:MAG: hypothetical protein EA378_09675 [Phycisphaerales bacterium]